MANFEIKSLKTPFLLDYIYILVGKEWRMVPKDTDFNQF